MPCTLCLLIGESCSRCATDHHAFEPTGSQPSAPCIHWNPKTDVNGHPRFACAHFRSTGYNGRMDAMVECLVNDTVALLGAVAKGDTRNAWVLADRLRITGWAWAMPRLASAAGAFQQSLESGPSSEAQMAAAIQAIASEMQAVVKNQG